MLNYLFYSEELNYPSDKYAFAPGISYPEYSWDRAELQDENRVYDAIRTMLKDMGLDKNNQETAFWNPLGEWIHPGMKVLIKPNFVMHKNGSDHPEDMESLVTHPSILRSIIDYTLIALKGDGQVIVADAPVKDCDFSLLMKNGKYDLIEEFYLRHKSSIVPQFIDLRGPEEEGGQYLQQGEGVIVNLADSSFFFCDNRDYSKYRIPNYDYRKVVEHHHGMTQEYMVNSLVLDADLIISIPKPKTHRKNGFTGALKNFVGINYSKEYLPHHTLGDINSGGDEYREENKYKRKQSQLRDNIDILRTKIDKLSRSNKDKRGIVRMIHEIEYRLMHRKKHRMWQKFGQYGTRDDMYTSGNNLDLMSREGAWHGNDTLWRTVLDLNLAVEYSGKDGIIHKNKQRQILYLGDMVISGEKEGPMAPSPKKVGAILFSDNPVEFDCILVKIMGFDWRKLKILKIALESELLSDIKYNEINIMSNLNRLNGYLKNIDIDICSAFTAGNGWQGHIELDEVHR